MAKVIMMRMAVFRDARNLRLVPTTKMNKLHQLVGDRDEQSVVYIVHPLRLVFAVNHEPIPRKDDGGIDTEQVTVIKILKVEYYH